MIYLLVIDLSGKLRDAVFSAHRTLEAAKKAAQRSAAIEAGDLPDIYWQQDRASPGHWTSTNYDVEIHELYPTV